jgi:two-component system, response regulator
MNDKLVLLVEDNEDDVTLTEMAFKKGQIAGKLVVVVDGGEALDFLFYQGKYKNRIPVENPALILLDLKLPLVSGLDVLKEIRADKNTSQIPVVILTSSLEEKDRSDSLRLGANDYICKPTGYSHFIEVIQQIKTKWLDGHESPPF